MKWRPQERRSWPPVVSLAAISLSAVCSVSAQADAAGPPSTAARAGESAVGAREKIREKIKGKTKTGTGKAGPRSLGFFVVAFIVAVVGIVVAIQLFKAVAGSWVRGVGDAGDAGVI